MCNQTDTVVVQKTSLRIWIRFVSTEWTSKGIHAFFIRYSQSCLSNISTSVLCNTLQWKVTLFLSLLLQRLTTISLVVICCFFTAAEFDSIVKTIATEKFVKKISLIKSDLKTYQCIHDTTYFKMWFKLIIEQNSRLRFLWAIFNICIPSFLLNKKIN